MAAARNAVTPFLFLLPNLIGFLAFTAGPVVAVFVLTFSGGEHGQTAYVGFDNWRRLASDADARRYLLNTVVLMASIPLNVAASLGLALLLHRKLRGAAVYRTIFFLPSISSGIAVFLIWRWILNPDLGLLNHALRTVGIEGPAWLADPAWAKPALMLMGLWIGMGGYNMVLFLAGLSEIDPALYEAAALDGAGRWARFRHVTWPQLAPTTFFILVTNAIGGFQVFDQAFVMTGGGPEGSTTTVVYYIYNLLYVKGDTGYAATVAVGLFALIFIATLANWAAGRRLSHGRAA